MRRTRLRTIQWWKRWSWTCAVLCCAVMSHAEAEVISATHAERVGEWYGAPLYRTTVTSPVHHIDRIYKSMQGPVTNSGFRLDPRAEPELLWLVGYEATIVNAEANSSLSQEFMCHSSIGTTPRAYRKLLPSRMSPPEGRLFTLAQGQSVVQFPPGFGIAYLPGMQLRLQSQVLNHNIEDADLDVRHRVSVDFVRDRDLEQPMIPLTLTGAFGEKLVEGDGGHFGIDPSKVNPELHGPGCSIGESAMEGHVRADAHGQKFTGHWIVKPGREVNHTRVTNQLRLHRDTTLHYAAIHLHPYAESLSFRDLTTDEIVFEVKGRSAKDRIALEHVEHVTSQEGLPLFKDHEYEVVSVYENDSGVDQDAMATVFFYIRANDVSVEEIRRRAARMSSAQKKRATN
jgi:hypothetical protein